MNHIVAYKKRTSSWKPPFLIATFLLVLSFAFDWHFYYIFYYFYAASFIAFMLSKYPYAQLDNERIVFFYGFFPFRKKISIDWDLISYAELGSIRKRFFAGSGPNSRGRIVTNYNHDIIRIYLKEKLSENGKKSLMNLSKLKFQNKSISFDDDSSSIILLDEPVEGFEKIVNDIAEKIKSPN